MSLSGPCKQSENDQQLAIDYSKVKIWNSSMWKLYGQPQGSCETQWFKTTLHNFRPQCSTSPKN